MKIVLIGIPGSGKSTQGNLLSQRLKIPYLSTGHIFRKIAREKTPHGHFIKQILHSGHLIPDEQTLSIVSEYLTRPEYKRGYILDGFPRTVRQAKKFTDTVEHVFYLEIPDKEVLWRLAYRDNSQRDDDTIQAIKKRIEVFHENTDPVIAYFEKKKILTRFDGTQPVETINEEILKTLGKQLVSKHIRAWHRKGKTIIAIVGLPGSGKSEAASYYKEKGFPSVYFGKAVLDYVKETYGTLTEAHEHKGRVELRQTHGKEALAKLNEKAISESLKKSDIVLIESMRSWEEYLYIRQKFPKVNVYIIAIHTSKALRYHRLAHRRLRARARGEQRDIQELEDTNMGSTIAFADFVVLNNLSLHDLHDELENVYRTIYFS